MSTTSILALYTVWKLIPFISQQHHLCIVVYHTVVAAQDFSNRKKTYYIRLFMVFYSSINGDYVG